MLVPPPKHGGFPALGGGEFARSAHDLGGFGVQGASVSARYRIPRGAALQHRGARGWGGIRSRWYSAHGTCFVDRIGMVHPCAQAQVVGPTRHRAGRARPVCCWAPGMKTSCADMCREQPAKTREKGLSPSRKRLPHHLFTGHSPPGRSLRPTALRSPRRERHAAACGRAFRWRSWGSHHGRRCCEASCRRRSEPPRGKLVSCCIV